MISKKFIIIGLVLGLIVFLYIFKTSSETQNQKAKPIVSKGCGDWGISVVSETEKHITVEDCKWGMGWSCRKYNIPKIKDQNGLKIYQKDKITFTNDNGKWNLKGHICEDSDDVEQNN